MNESAARRGVRIGAVCWIAALHNLVVELLVAAAWPSPYSFARNAISDLGNTACGPFEQIDGSTLQVCSPLHWLMNGSFVAYGLLVVAGAVLTRRAWPARRSATAGLVLLAVSGAGVIVVGLVPENADLALHSVPALIGFVAQNAAMVALGVATTRSAPWLSRFSVACGAAGLAATVLLLVGIDLGLGSGGMERVAANPLTLWLLVTGLWLLRHGTAGRGTATSPGGRPR
ncbi:hypothetical protein Nocox_21975 [Nonomuraea coxensis DSM 45129]|uniref:DUF998 domain-containing protein n=1 Tax=Nonomuraea coxensis DSM 45129 TaxID=1122611 RepID=A0ABX8U5I7_9ACTN|nr:DUF998 domain-containing protein [Nonomuraea coxensis]QYC41999.1 hypothetical protein Nocox_21975 [Nonomuraea coxensis DSM 45129]